MAKISRRFPCQGSECGADLWLPDGVEAAPVVVMAQGYGSERNFGNQGLIAALLEAGIAVFSFDYRGFGDSDAIKGQQRQLVDPLRQLEDWQAALNAVQALEQVDSQRIAIWGSSFGGGHVISVAGSEWIKPFNLKGVVSQVPHCDSRNAFRQVGARVALKGAFNGIKASLLALVGVNHTVPVVGRPQDSHFSVMQHAGWYEGYHRIAEGSLTWVNAIPAVSLLKASSYNPIDVAANIHCPVLMVYGKQDAGCAFDDVERTANLIPEVEQFAYEGDHFDVYDGGSVQPEAVEREVAFLSRVLSKQV